nr:PREDICTED: protein NATD1 [Bos mutus]
MPSNFPELKAMSPRLKGPLECPEGSSVVLALRPRLAPPFCPQPGFQWSLSGARVRRLGHAHLFPGFMSASCSFRGFAARRHTASAEGGWKTLLDRPGADGLRGFGPWTLRLKGCHDRAVLLYEYVGKRIVDLQHTEVPDAYRGRGIAKHLAKAALDFVVEEDLRAHVTCWYIQKFVKENPLPQYLERLQP